MIDIDALFDEVAPEVEPPGRGGKREGAGRKRGAKTARDAETGETEAQKYAKSKARHEAAKADIAEIEALKLARSVVDRQEVREACAKAFAAISQSLDSIPDGLEQELGVEPEVAEKVRARIDAAKAELAADLKRMFEEEGDEE